MLNNVRLSAQGAARRFPACVMARLLLAIAATAFVSSAVAADLDTEVVFHIKSQRLDSALLEFSKQANTPVAFAAKSIGSLRTPGLEGKYPARAALSALLCNSGLIYTQVGDTVTVVPISVERNVQPCGAPSEVTRRD
jgi:iron complex outermembrane receptor protein